jgi:hypothetical protein
MIDESGHGSRAYKCAQIIGVVELVLEPDEYDQEKENWELYEETGVEFFRDAAMRQPLVKRHALAAYEEFHKLRQGVLSAQGLRRWRKFLQLCRHIEEGDE